MALSDRFPFSVSLWFRNSVTSGAYAALEYIPGATVGTQRLAGFLDRQEYARVRIPKILRRQRAVQRQVGRRHFDLALLAGVLDRVHGCRVALLRRNAASGRTSPSGR